jgi:hypothetical protein
MIISICIPPTPPAVTAKPVQVDHCRSFSDLQHAAEWLKERGIVMPCEPHIIESRCKPDWRWP